MSQLTSISTFPSFGMCRSQEYFDASVLATDTSGNWALRGNNLRKLLRNLESYYHSELNKTNIDFEYLSDNLTNIARQPEENAECIGIFVEMLVAACVTCPNKGRYIQWIMEMTSENQVIMKEVIEISMSKLEDHDGAEIESSMENGNLDESYMSDDDDVHFEGEEEMNGLFRNAMQNLDSATEGMDITIASHSEHSNDGILNSSMNDNVLRKERDALKAALAEAKRELATQKSNAETAAEDAETTQTKLRALATDLQERLEERQKELNDSTEKLVQTQRTLDDAEAKINDLTEKNVTLEDELDIANAKAQQLKKAEATVVAYRKKLEGAGMMNQTLSDLENQSAKYLSQIVELEMETKKIPELQKLVDDTSRELHMCEKEKNAMAEKVTAKTAEVAQLKTELSASINAKKMMEEEVQNLRSLQDSEHPDVDSDLNIGGLSLTSAQSMSDVKEKIMRLEIENKSLKKKLDTEASASNVAPSADESVVKSMEAEIERLQAELKKKEAASAKLASDKDKLEAYTKKTLSKFQEKYLVALQECKAKLKEKHDKIEALELRSAAEKSNQKKEEKLLSSTIYELGLSLMQQKLKGAQ